MTDEKSQVDFENREVEFAEDSERPQQDSLDETVETVAAVPADAADAAVDNEPQATAETAESSSDESVLDEQAEVTVSTVIEAILFASDEPLSLSRLADIAELSGSAKQVRSSIDALNEKYRAANCAFRIESLAGGFQMMTLSVYNSWLRKLLRVRTDNKLTQASLETLAIVAYKQPIMRADVESIRGVASGELLRSLMYKGLVKIVGRAEVLGRPMLYGTTKKFLELFGLNTLKDLPKVEELKKPVQ